MKRCHRRRTCSHTSPRRSPTMVSLHGNRFVECRWWNDGWTVKTVVTWRSSASMIPAPGFKSLAWSNRRKSGVQSLHLPLTRRIPNHLANVYFAVCVRLHPSVVKSAFLLHHRRVHGYLCWYPTPDVDWQVYSPQPVWMGSAKDWRWQERKSQAQFC